MQCGLSMPKSLNTAKVEIEPTKNDPFLKIKNQLENALIWRVRQTKYRTIAPFDRIYDEQLRWC